MPSATRFFRRYPAGTSRLQTRRTWRRSSGRSVLPRKARRVIGASREIVDRFSGCVPGRMEDLLTLPGVGRKTANIVLDHAFGVQEGVAVDTHVARLSRRLGFSSRKDPAGIERDLMALSRRTRGAT